MHNPRMDPSSAVARLLSQGMSEQGIAAALKINQSTVNRIRRGVVTPSYGVGKALIDLAQQKPVRRQRRVNH